MVGTTHRKTLAALLGGASWLAAASAWAQTPPPVQPPTESPVVEESQTPEDTEAVDEVVVVGSRIRRGIDPGPSPVTLVDQERIEEFASPTVDELLRTLPQASNVQFNSENNGVNDARGDVASVNLRSLGAGNTLILLNGRRLVSNPTTQTENDVPIVIVNANTLPSQGIQRLEVLRDGAGPIYGADAVSGVLNTVTRSDFDGLEVGVRHGFSEGTSLKETTGTLFGGRTFNDGQTNVSLFAGYFDRDGIDSNDRFYARGDLRPLANQGYEGDSDFDNRSQSSPFGEFNTRGPTGAGVRVRRGSENITNTTGRFQTQPGGFEGGVPIGSGAIEVDDGNLDADLRYDTTAPAIITPDAHRTNLFATANHKLTDTITLFGEVLVYVADTESRRAASPVETANNVVIPRSNFYNPFGPVRFADGTLNPNRLAGIDAPVQGLDVDLRRYRFVDIGPRIITVDSTTYRGVGGVRGEYGRFDYEAAIGYSTARNDDHETRVSKTALQRALARSTPDAYNPFNGALGQNSAAVGQEIVVDFVRESKSSLLLADARLTSSELYVLPTGALGAAVGVEYRRETYDENRDSRVDGTIGFTDPTTGIFDPSDIVGSSATPDSSGERDVYSAYAELLVPLFNAERPLPFLQSAELQLAARVESYSDFGQVFKPKAALAVRFFDALLLRGSYTEGFRAPNLVQLNEGTINRFDTGFNDIYRSRVTNSPDDSNRVVVNERRSNPDLEPEDSTSYALGVVIDAPFVSGLRFSVDYFKIEQEGVVGLFGDTNQIRLDDVLRRMGSSNPAVVRAAPDADDIAAYAAYNRANGTNFAPAGDLIQVNETYTNLDPISSSGIDFQAFYQSPNTRYGRFDAEFNLAYLLEVEQQPSALAQTLLDDPLVDPIGGSVGDLIERATANPRHKGNLRLGYRAGPFRASTTIEYIGRVFDESANQDSGEIRPRDVFQVRGLVTVDGAVSYEIEDSPTPLNNVRVRFGIRNIFDKDPPLADETYGYVSSLHNNRGRFMYLDLRKTF